MAPSLCGNLVHSRRSLLALGWTITTVTSAAAFLTAALFVTTINARYYRLASYASTDTDDNIYDNDHRNEEEKEGSGSHDSADNKEGETHDDEYWYYPTLASVSSSSVKFAGVYTATLAVALGLYGSTSVVGFTSVGGRFIEPCVGGLGTKSPDSAKISVGIFMGCLVLFANLCMVCAVVLGEIRVVDYLDDRDREELDSYAVEKVAKVLSTLCVVLSILYLGYAMLLFTYHDELLPPDENSASDNLELSTMRTGVVHRDTGMKGDPGVVTVYAPPSRSPNKRRDVPGGGGGGAFIGSVPPPPPTQYESPVVVGATITQSDMSGYPSSTPNLRNVETGGYTSSTAPDSLVYDPGSGVSNGVGGFRNPNSSY